MRRGKGQRRQRACSMKDEQQWHAVQKLHPCKEHRTFLVLPREGLTPMHAVTQIPGYAPDNGWAHTTAAGYSRRLTRPPTKPAMMAAHGSTTCAPAVMDTKPTSTPLHSDTRSHACVRDGRFAVQE